MRPARPIPPDVLVNQIAASDPATSAWVSANAGSGKTHVLTQRVIRLLLAGIDPAKILCITFTKAAAANMANRVFDTLAQWTAFDDAALDQAIAAVGGGKADAAMRARARRLFATALETPGGLKVQTIHAFCTRLLHQFPFEANVAARFTVLDDTATSQLLDQLLLEVLLEGAAEPTGRIGRALASAITFAADQTFKDVVRAAIAERRKVHAWLAAAGDIDAAMAQLSVALGIDPGESREGIEDEFWADSPIEASEWPAIAAVLAGGSQTDREQGDRFLALAEKAGAERLDTYLEIFCTAKPALTPRRNIVTRAIQQNYPNLCEQLAAEQARVGALLERRRAVACRDRTAALLTIADAVLQRYQAQKDRRGLLDYEDLIDKTLALFGNVGATWVLYKLDLGIDHILIDEAQDTSAPQWQIVDTLVSEFAAGAGARGAIKRTLFAVGDDKQSIFSFQGAEPRRFAEMKAIFERRFKDAELEWNQLKFDASFRSGASVLGAVDTVFAQPQAYRALTADPVWTVHRALPDAAPGVVEIWDLCKADQRDQIEPWDAPFDTRSETSPQVRLARRIAGTIAVWRRAGRRPGEILILVRQRGALFDAVIRALTAAGIAVAGADRLLLLEHIAVMDLVVLADALLLPQDDLALATVLRSPLFDISDEQLFALAFERRGSLWTALRDKAGDDPAFAEARARLGELADLARRETPFGFYAQILGAGGGRKRLLTRLGHEADDALDEFLNLALDYESRETPSLQGFLAWLRSANAEVKRDMEITRDEVRVMTVHGAKGLEAPIVILADTTTKPTGPRDPALLMLPAQNAPPDTPDRIAWVKGQAEDVKPLQTARMRARQDASEEHARLLYVAMTRAAERLIVCGTKGLQKLPEGCWYDLVRNALQGDAVVEPADDGEGTVLRFRKGEAESARGIAAEQQMLPLEPPQPPWLIRAAPAALAHGAAITPSTAVRSDAARAPKRAAPLSSSALVRGRIVHRLLQALPDIPAQAREAAARRYLLRHGGAFTPAEQDAMVAQVLAVLDTPRFAALFAPGSRGEVPIVGRVALSDGTSRLVNGQVDRLVVTPKAVLIADFKTDRPAPRIAPEAYVAQLALYRAVLGRVYPDRTVRAALLWTEGPELVELSAADLDRALAAVTSP
jgi:ATP-dependent helicase/nuclease subunit A